MEEPGLKRALGLFEISAYGVGIIVGAGIYALIGSIAGLAGNAVWLSFILSSFLAVFTGLSYAELSSIFPRDAAEYEYVKSAMGSRYLSFLITWFVLGMLIISASTVAIGFGNYFSALLFGKNWYIANMPVILALFAIVLMSYVNFRGVELSSRINVPATMLEVGGLVFIVIGVGVLIAKGNVSVPDYMEMSTGLEGVLHGAILAFFAYIGFGSLAKMSEEVKNPERTIPLAIIISIAITTVIYVLVALASVAAVPWQELRANPEPIAAVAYRINPSYRFVLSIIALFSTGNTILLTLISASRMIYGVAIEGSMPSILKKINPRTRTPHYAIAVTAILASSFALLRDIETIAEVTNLWIFTVYAFVNASLIMLRYKGDYISHGFKVPLNIGRFPVVAVFGLLFSTGMVVYTATLMSIKHPGLWLTLLLIISATCFYRIQNER